MKKQFFLHIGFKKTATSTIQDFLETNSENLLEKGCLYPWGSREEHKELARVSKRRSANTANNSGLLNADLDIWAELHKLIEATACDRVVVSAENFESYNPSHIQSFQDRLNRYQTKVVIYIRRQDLRFESHYLQVIKTGVFTGSIRAYFQAYPKQTLDYFRYVEIWASVFGRENIIVRVLEKSQMPDVCLDFLNAIGLEGEISAFQKTTSNQNVKPNLDQMRALKLINDSIANLYSKKGDGSFRLHLDYDFVDRYSEPFYKYISFADSASFCKPVPFCEHSSSEWISPSKYKVLPYRMAQNILSRYEASNKQLAGQYLCRSNGTLFCDPLDTEYKVDSLDASCLNQERLVTVCSFLQSNIVKFGAAKKVAHYLLCLPQDLTSADLSFPFYRFYLDILYQLNPYNHLHSHTDC